MEYRTSYRLLGLLILSSLLAAGCASSKGPKYVPPSLPDSEVAIVKGSWGTYIEKVNGANVTSAGLQWSNFGSNTVRVPAGVNRFKIVMSYGGQYSHKDTYAFDFICDKGHMYEFSANNMFDTTLKVVDKTTNQSMLIEIE